MKRAFLKVIYGTIRRWEILYCKLLYRLKGIDGVSNYIKTLSNPAPAMKAFGASIDVRTIIYPGVILHAAHNGYSNLVIGKDCRIGRGVFFDLTEKITVGDTVNLAMRTVVLTHVNVNRSPIKDLGYESRSAPVIFRKGDVTFAGAKVLMGVEMAECSVLSAGSVISTDTKPYGVYVGNPGRLIRTLQRTGEPCST